MFSCSKKEINSVGAANQNLFYQDQNIAVANMQGVRADPGFVTVSFSTLYEKNIGRIELRRSRTTNSFCTIDGKDISTNSSFEKQYLFHDDDIKGEATYYMLRFENTVSEWAYSSCYTLQLN